MAEKRAPQRLTPKQKAAKKRKTMIIFIIEIIALAAVIGFVVYGFNSGLFSGLFNATNSEINTSMEMGTSSDGTFSSGDDVVYYNTEIVGNLDDNNEIVFAEDNAMSGYYQIALFGVDSRSKNLSKGDNRSDTIIIACVDKKTHEVKLCSVYRDTYLNLGNDKYAKCNGAFAAGGATNAISMLNMNLDLAITDYVVVGFTGLVDIIDALGGVWIDVKENEINHLNNYQISIVGKTTDNVTYTADEGKDYIAVKNPGYQLLNGLQATAYCRIRYVGSDWGRTERQRTVIAAAIEQAKKMDTNTLLKIMNSDVFSEFSTSLDVGFITDVLTNLSSYEIVDSQGFPSMDMLTTGNIGSKGSCVVPVSLEKNVTWLHEMLFGDTGYDPSSAVKGYSVEIYNQTVDYLH
ncbi:MAG: LCP family protein [Lachnospiraceae bacterium]|nr:LCP family protein [Candidatus Merdinaster equi]